MRRVEHIEKNFPDSRGRPLELRSRFRSRGRKIHQPLARLGSCAFHDQRRPRCSRLRFASLNSASSARCAPYSTRSTPRQFPPIPQPSTGALRAACGVPQRSRELLSFAIAVVSHEARSRFSSCAGVTGRAIRPPRRPPRAGPSDVPRRNRNPKRSSPRAALDSPGRVLRGLWVSAARWLRASDQACHPRGYARTIPLKSKYCSPRRAAGIADCSRSGRRASGEQKSRRYATHDHHLFHLALPGGSVTAVLFQRARRINVPDTARAARPRRSARLTRIAPLRRSDHLAEFECVQPLRLSRPAASRAKSQPRKCHGIVRNEP